MRILLLTSILLAACRSEPSADVAAPLPGVSNAYACAAQVTLTPREGEHWPGLDNVFHLSQRVLSGSEPVGPEAFERLASWGVRTILSVDGKTPDAGAAAAVGIRTVHVPVQYSGHTPEQLARIAKTFRELEGPFYVHCFHGHHRGPATAAIGRLVLDGAPREQALAEMRQWAGTSSKYEGLYDTLASVPVPTRAVTEALAFDFPAAAPVGGMREAMVRLGRVYEQLELLAENDFQPDRAHPDLAARPAATELRELFEACAALESVKQGPDNLRGWMAVSVADARALGAALDAADTARADTALGRLAENCAACHGAYRNN